MKFQRLLDPTAWRLSVRAGVGILARWCSFTLAGIALTALFDAFWPLNRGLRAAVASAFALGFAITLVALFRTWRNRYQLACRYLDHHGGEGRVYGAYELYQAPAGAWGDASLTRAEVEAVCRILENLPPPKLRIGRPLRIIALSIGLITYAAAFDKGALGHQVIRVLAPWSDRPPLRKGHITWLWPPENFTLPVGGSCRVEVAIPQVMSSPQLVVLATEGGLKRTVSLAPGGSARWVGSTGELRTTVKLVVYDGPFRSEPRKVRILARRGIEDVLIECKPPDYTGLPAIRVRPEGGRFRALSGSHITLHVKAPGASSGRWRFLSGDREIAGDSLELCNGELKGSFTLSEQGILQIEVKLPEPSTRAFLFECLEDEPPSVDFRFPPPYLIACAGSVLPVEITARDDLGLSELVLEVDGKKRTWEAGGARTYTALYKLSIPPGEVAKLLLTATARDIRKPRPNSSPEAARVVRAVSARAFKLLRQAEALRALLKRLRALQTRLLQVHKRLVELRAQKVLNDQALSGLKSDLQAFIAALSELKADPLFEGEASFAAPILQRAEGLRRLAVPPETRRREWLSRLSYFVDELRAILEKLLGEARQAAQAEPFFLLLARVSSLPEKQLAVIQELSAGRPPGELSDSQRSIRDTIVEVPKKLLAEAPLRYKKTAREVSGFLQAPELRRAAARALVAMLGGDRDSALESARKVYTGLDPLRKFLASRRVLGPVSLADLLRALAAGLEERRKLDLAQDTQIVLWGPGVEAEKKPAAPPEPLKGGLSLGAPKLPRKLSFSGSFWEAAVKKYERALKRITGKSRPAHGKGL